jgi:hypothetical protein
VPDQRYGTRQPNVKLCHRNFQQERIQHLAGSSGGATVQSRLLHHRFYQCLHALIRSWVRNAGGPKSRPFDIIGPSAWLRPLIPSFRRLFVTAALPYQVTVNLLPISGMPPKRYRPGPEMQSAPIHSYDILPRKAKPVAKKRSNSLGIHYNFSKKEKKQL